MVDFFEQLRNQLDKYEIKYQSRRKLAAIKLLFFIVSELIGSKKHISKQRDNILHAAVLLKGGIGDHVLNCKYLLALREYWGSNVKLDVLVLNRDWEAIRGILLNQIDDENIVVRDKRGKVFKNYDLVIEICRYPSVLCVDKRRLEKFGNENTKHYIKVLEEFAETNPYALKYDVFGNYLAQLHGKMRENQADIDNLLGLKDYNFEIKCQKTENEIREKFGLSKKYITLQCGAGVWIEGKRDLRQWQNEYYEELCQLLKKEYPEYDLVQLGSKIQYKIKAVDKDLRGKTDFEELKGVLKYAAMHIQQEGGMPYMRHYLTNKPSCVLFGPNDNEFLGYDNNINIRVSNCRPCTALSKVWPERCLVSGGEALCMKAITPQIVLRKIKEKLC